MIVAKYDYEYWTFIYLAGEEGIEPLSTILETAILPLNYPTVSAVVALRNAQPVGSTESRMYTRIQGVIRRRTFTARCQIHYI